MDSGGPAWDERASQMLDEIDRAEEEGRRAEIGVFDRGADGEAATRLLDDLFEEGLVRADAEPLKDGMGAYQAIRGLRLTSRGRGFLGGQRTTPAMSADAHGPIRAEGLNRAGLNVDPEQFERELREHLRTGDNVRAMSAGPQPGANRRLRQEYLNWASTLERWLRAAVTAPLDMNEVFTSRYLLLLQDQIPVVELPGVINSELDHQIARLHSSAKR